MKDSAISYDIINQQQQHGQPQVSSWQQHRQQQHQQTHTTSVYSNHTAQQQDSQRSPIGAHHHQQQQSQQQHAAQLGQYQHQQLQSSAHHNTAAAAAAYYQQAHMYPSYQAHAHPQEPQQPQPQQSGSDQQQHHHGSTITTTGPAASVVDAAVVAAAQQQHASVHHSQTANAQTPTLNHTGWSPGVGGLAPQPHHAVVTDHSNLAYMTHAYQSHNSSVTDHHHRNSSASISNQSIGTGPQGSSYAVDSLYNTPAAAAAAVAAAYGYNNYNAAFFQTSNNGPHTQTGHHNPAGLSGFWGGHNQSQQHSRTSHSQGLPNQASLQQRQQQLAPEQATSYLHDPRLYYGRPPYGQGMQNFGQHHSQSQSQADVHHRLAALTQQSNLLQHDQQIHQLTHQQLHHQSPALTTQQTPTSQGAQNSTHQHQPQPAETQLLASNPQQLDVIGQSDQHNRKFEPPTTSNITQKQPPAETEATKTADNHVDSNPLASTKQTMQSNSVAHKTQPAPNSKFDLLSSNKHGIADGAEPSIGNSLKSDNKSQSVIKSDLTGQYQPRKQSTTTLSQAPARNSYHNSQEDRSKTQNIDSSKKVDRDQRQTALAASMEAAKNQASATCHQSTDLSSLEDSMAGWSIGTRKTTWASIASQPAKVSQPKSLKSKIAGSNSVLSSAKHLTAVSMDSSNMESKNGINPAIKRSVSAAATSSQRSSIPPPISKVAPPSVANLKLDLLGENSESTKISWPVVNASINLTLNDPPPQKENTTSINQAQQEVEQKQEESHKFARDYKDHNHNQGPKTINPYHQSSHINRRDDRREDHWQRRDQRDFHTRVTREPERKEQEAFEGRSIEQHVDHQREHHLMNPRRDAKPSGNLNRPGNQYRGGDEGPPYQRDREFAGGKRPGPVGGPIMDRSERHNDSYHNQRFPKNRFEHSRDNRESHDGRHNNNNMNNPTEAAPHHHYNNVRDGNSLRNPQSKPDLSVHPHLNPANFNPNSFNCEPENARYFIIKSYSEDDIHRSIKYSIWCSTNHGNRRLDEAYRQQQAKNGQLFLFFSVNGSGHFCGMAQMTSAVDFDSSSGVWAQSKWQGEFSVKWIYVKDVPNGALRHITLENNEDKPVTNSRDTQEVPSEKGKAVLKILHQYNHSTSIFDDFLHYERRQEEEKLKKSSHIDHPPAGRGDERGSGSRFNNRPFVNARSHNDFHQGGGGGWSNRERMPRYT